MIRTVLREVALTVGALLGLACLALAVAGLAWGVKPLVFVSGSMSPTIPAGALALTKPVPAAQVHRGDIVSVVNMAGTRVTHRVVSAAPLGGAVQLTLKGDANREPDAEAYDVARADRVFWSAPTLGRVVTTLAKPPFVFAAGALVGGWIVFWWARRGPKEAPEVGDGTQARHRRSRRNARNHANVSDVTKVVR